MGQVLVTGGAGFIGLQTVRMLLDKGYPVTVLDNFINSCRSSLPRDIRIYEMDIRDRQVGDVFARQRFSQVIHLAAQTDVGVSTSDPGEDCAVNICGLINVLLAAGAAKVKRFIFASSAAVYGSSDQLPHLEETAGNPQSFYGLSKWAGEHYVKIFSRLCNFEYMILRYANVYGPHGKGGVVNNFLRCIKSGKPVYVFGTGEQTRDFVFCKDVAKANVLACISEHANAVMNISTMRPTKINEVIRQLQIFTGKKIDIIHKPARPEDNMHSCLANKAAQEKLRWIPETELAEGLGILLAT